MIARPHEKTFLRDVLESKYKRHRDEMPPRFARRAEHFYGEHKRVREGITAWGSPTTKALSGTAFRGFLGEII